MIRIFKFSLKVFERMEVSVAVGDSSEGLLIAIRLAQVAANDEPFLRKVHVLVFDNLLKDFDTKNICLNGKILPKKVRSKLRFLKCLPEDSKSIKSLSNCYIHILCMSRENEEVKRDKFMRKYSQWLKRNFDKRCFLVLLDTISALPMLESDSKGNNIFDEVQLKYSLKGAAGFVCQLEINKTRVEVNEVTKGFIIVERISKERKFLTKYLTYLEEMAPALYVRHKPRENTTNWLYPCLAFKTFVHYLSLYQDSSGTSHDFYKSLTLSSDLRLVLVELVEECFDKAFVGQDLSLFDLSGTPLGATLTLYFLKLLLRLPNFAFSFCLQCLFLLRYSKTSFELTQIKVKTTDEIEYCRAEVLKSAVRNNSPMDQFTLFKKDMKWQEMVKVAKEKHSLVNEVYCYLVIGLVPILLWYFWKFILHAVHILFYT